jgi:thiamine-phosphate pyrophosphorylase
MLVVISNPTPIADEAGLINGLFDEGLEVLHLRKPDTSADEIRLLLEKIKPQYHSQISLHQHHEMAKDFGIKRLHLTEINRKKGLHSPLPFGEGQVGILSTSIHDVNDYQTLPETFEYTFFGPVFDSISKPGYTSSLSDNFVFPIKTGYPKVIAIGGIDASNVHRVKQMNFSGAAVLGTIWSKPEESISRFKTIQKTWSKTGQ